MAGLVQLGTVGETASGEMKAVLLDGREVLAARAGNEYYVSDNRCPHPGGHMMHRCAVRKRVDLFGLLEQRRLVLGGDRP